MGKRPNFYILLELPFEPAVSDKAEIEKAITAKQQQWSKEMNNPIKKVKASEYLALLNEIKKVMFSESLRANEAQDAVIIKEKKSKELETRLSLYAAKSDELSEKDLKIILKNFSAFGFKQQDVEEQFSKLIENQNKKIDLSQTIDKNQAKNIRNFMQQLGRKDETLYDFLNLSKSSSCELLLKAASDIKNKILAKGKKTGEDNAKQSICGLCAVIFKDKASKSKYDNYVNLTKYYSVNEAIEEMGYSNKKIIEPKMKEKLVDIAVEKYHISPSEASAYISNYCELIDFQERDKSIICGLCNTENLATSTICQNCHKTLLIICPVCSAVNSNAAQNCVKCSFDLTKMQDAVHLIEKAKELWLDKQADEAIHYLKQAAIFWPNHQEIKPLENEINKYKNDLNDIVSKIDTYLEEKKYYHAAHKIKQAEMSGFIINTKIKNNVFNKIKYVQDKLVGVKSLEANEAFNLLSHLFDEVTDSEEIKTLLSQYPPQAPKNISYKIEHETVILNWSKSNSIGELKYILLKKQGSYPNSIDDGEIIYEGKETSFSDSQVKASVVYHYAVFTVRLGLNSTATRLEDKVVIVENVKNIKAVGGDGFVVLSWDDVPESLTEVKIWQYKGITKPESIQFCKEVECNRTDKINISGLTNNERYWFYICAGHSINGQEYYSEKMLIYAVPCKIAKPLKNFKIAQENNVFRANFDECEWDVVFFYCDKEPDYVENTVYSLEELLKKYKSLEFTSKSLQEAEFIMDFVGRKYIIPAQINANNVVLNKAVMISSIPQVVDLTYSFNSPQTELYINFTWPDEIHKVLLLYRTDAYPQGISDPLAKSIDYSKKQYERNDGITLMCDGEQSYYISICAVYEDENPIFSKPSQLFINKKQQLNVYYDIKYKKSMFSSKASLALNIKSDTDCVFPEFCIVSKYKSVPLNRSDGDIIYIKKQKTQINKNCTFEIEIAKLANDVKFRLFLLDDLQYNFFRITNESKN